MELHIALPMIGGMIIILGGVLPMGAVMAEMFGKANGCSRGRGGSMRLFDASRRFYGGLAIGIPYLMAAYRGWVGGIVSVDKRHISRLNDPREGTYYFVTLLLQIVPYSLAGGAGVRVGVAYLRRRQNPGPLWMGLPREAVVDVLWIYLLVVPLFALDRFWSF